LGLAVIATTFLGLLAWEFRYTAKEALHLTDLWMFHHTEALTAKERWRLECLADLIVARRHVEEQARDMSRIRRENCGQ
jgi:hypothetical protein